MTLSLHFDSWEQISQHLHHRRGITTTQPACYHAAWAHGAWTPEQDLTRCTCAVRQMIAQALQGGVR